MPGLEPDGFRDSACLLMDGALSLSLWLQGPEDLGQVSAHWWAWATPDTTGCGVHRVPKLMLIC